MSWATMSSELTGQVPGLDIMFAFTLVNRAWVDVQRKFIWSFLWGDAAIPTPIPVSTGTVTAVRGLNTIVGDTAASAAWATFGLVNPITVRQFRVGQGTIYNIIGYDISSHAPFGTLTLDSPYVDPLAGVGIGYQIIQSYFNAPTSDFIWWETLLDPTSGYDLRTTLTREFVDARDPQRFQSGWPVGAIPYKINPNAGNFFQFPMYELWPTPTAGYTYTGQYFRRGKAFVNPTDAVLAPLGEDVVLALSKQYAYEWAGANQDRIGKIAKSDFRFWAGYAQKQYDGLISDYILMDESFSHRHLIDSAESSYLSALPWVSAREGLGYFPA